jgi:two-component system, LytTR family, response regulator
MINCLIIDDEQAAIDVIKYYIKSIPSLNLVAESLNPVEALEFVYTKQIDLIFIDIQMPQLSGLDFIRLTQGRCKFIFSTAYKHYAFDGYENNVVDYLLKPISFERFLQAIQKVQEILNPTKILSDTNTPKPDDFIFVKIENRMQKVNLSEILFIEGFGNYVRFHTTKGKFISLLNIKDLEGELPADSFMRVHRSYIISLDKIEFVEGNQIYIDNDTFIPLGETFKSLLWTNLESRVVSGKK